MMDGELRLVLPQSGFAHALHLGLSVFHVSPFAARGSFAVMLACSMLSLMVASRGPADAVISCHLQH